METLNSLQVTATEHSTPLRCCSPRQTQSSILGICICRRRAISLEPERIRSSVLVTPYLPVQWIALTDSVHFQSFHVDRCRRSIGRRDSRNLDPIYNDRSNESWQLSLFCQMLDCRSSAFRLPSPEEKSYSAPPALLCCDAAIHWLRQQQLHPQSAEERGNTRRNHDLHSCCHRYIWKHNDHSHVDDHISRTVKDFRENRFYRLPFCS